MGSDNSSGDTSPGNGNPDARGCSIAIAVAALLGIIIFSGIFLGPESVAPLIVAAGCGGVIVELATERKQQ